ncbi:MAG: NAD-dependent epimerase/dehydratase family protein [bacterium]
MKILITGASGTIGSDLAPSLTKFYDVLVTDLKKPDNDLDFLYCDITNPDEVDNVVKGIDVVIHLAALLPGDFSSGKFVDINTKGTLNILESALKNGVKKVIYASSVWAASRGSSIYQPIDENIPCRPEGMYDITKLMGEFFCEYFSRMHKLNTVTFRLCGYDRIEGFTEDGDILWDKIDIRALVGRFVGMGPSYKLTNSWDLGQAFKSAIENKIDKYDVYIIGIGMPFIQKDAEDLKKEPVKVIEKYYPGASKFFEDIDLKVPGIGFWYNTEKARRDLGFYPKYSFSDIMRLYYEFH